MWIKSTCPFVTTYLTLTSSLSFVILPPGLRFVTFPSASKQQKTQIFCLKLSEGTWTIWKLILNVSQPLSPPSFIHTFITGITSCQVSLPAVYKHIHLYITMCIYSLLGIVIQQLEHLLQEIWNIDEGGSSCLLSPTLQWKWKRGNLSVEVTPGNLSRYLPHPFFTTNGDSWGLKPSKFISNNSYCWNAVACTYMMLIFGGVVTFAKEFLSLPWLLSIALHSLWCQ